MELGLNGKTVIITGGSGGIGQGLVLEFAREGCNVVNASRDEATGEKLAKKAQEQGLPGKVLSVSTDVTQRASVDAMIEKAHLQFGLIDVLVNNAGGVAHLATIEDIDEEARRWEIALNIDGVMNCCQAVSQDMFGRGGSIINISSNSSLHGEAATNVGHYGATKGFVNSATKIMAWNWAKRGVRVNNICPGWIVPYHEDDIGGGSFWNRFGFEQIGTLEGMEQAVNDGTLLGISSLPIARLGRPEDVANLTMFLASERSSYITGQLISVSGGAYMP
ncbi:MAG: short-chain dehydrogenase [Verrucomicrobiaceae bacterium]|nr:short-chain dehydrogenase [Verrucomicrobiaceae bacterium]